MRVEDRSQESTIEDAAPFEEAQEEAEQQPQQQPQTAQLDPEARAALLEDAKEAAYLQFAAEQQAQQTLARQSEQEDPYEQLAYLAQTDAVAFVKAMESRSVGIAKEQLTREWKPTIDRVNHRDAINLLGKGLDNHGQQYLGQILANSSPEQLQDKTAQDVIRRAAQNYSDEMRGKNPEPTNLSPSININRSDFAEYNQDRKQWGLSPITEREYADLSEKK